jgi:small nuclear ribonucleoprotein (snRNP)-like protein
VALGLSSQRSRSKNKKKESNMQAMEKPADAGNRVRRWLDALLRVELSDGRVLTGKFGCFDKQKNILLVETREQRFLGSNKCIKPDFERHLGLVLIPWQYAAAVHAIDS